jgi:hypothetical protein
MAPPPGRTSPAQGTLYNIMKHPGRQLPNFGGLRLFGNYKLDEVLLPVSGSSQPYRLALGDPLNALSERAQSTRFSVECRERI